MTLSKLSLRNARRQARDYLVYFVTIVMAAALVYAFNGLVFSGEIGDLSSMLDSLPLMIVLASIVVVCIIGWLILYTTDFMLSRRGRELGTYILIGMENRQVARLFFLENLVVGTAAFLLGTLLGNLIFQALRAITLALFHAPYTFSFAFSLKAVLLTLFYFALMYLLALFKSRRRIRRMKICDLIYFDRKNEGEVLQKGRSRQKVFVISILLGIAGTLLLLLHNLTLGLLGAFFVILFLYGFFISFSSGVPAWFEKRPEKKYAGGTLLIFRSLSAKLATMGIVMATIALLFTATIISEGSGMLFNAMFASRGEQTTCFDLFIGISGGGEDAFEDYLEYIGANIPVRDSRRYDVYQSPGRQVMDYIESSADYWSIFEYDTLMKASDYTALRAMLDYPAVSLAPGEYFVHCMPYLEEVMEAYDQPLILGDNALRPGGVRAENFTQSLWEGNGRGFILVVPDEIAAASPVSHSIYAAMTPGPVPAESFSELCGIRDERDARIQDFDTIYSRASVEAENAAMYAVIVFPLYYLALVLTMASATILTIQQLSETGRYRRQFELLRKLGMDRREMKRTLIRQFAIFYSMPAVPSLLISIPFLLGLGGEFEPGVLSGPGQQLAVIGAALGMFFSIYLIYILMAYMSLKRNVLQE